MDVSLGHRREEGAWRSGAARGTGAGQRPLLQIGVAVSRPAPEEDHFLPTKMCEDRRAEIHTRRLPMASRCASCSAEPPPSGGQRGGARQAKMSTHQPGKAGDAAGRNGHVMRSSHLRRRVPTPCASRSCWARHAPLCLQAGVRCTATFEAYQRHISKGRSAGTHAPLVLKTVWRHFPTHGPPFGVGDCATLTASDARMRVVCAWESVARSRSRRSGVGHFVVGSKSGGLAIALFSKAIVRFRSLQDFWF